jgi:hypothetical protein
VGSCHLAMFLSVRDHIREVHEPGPSRDARLDEYDARIKAANVALVNRGTTANAIYRSYRNAHKESFMASATAFWDDGSIDAFTYSVAIRELVDVDYMTTTAYLKEQMCSHVSLLNAYDLHHP